MKTAESARAILAEMQLGYIQPFSLEDLVREWKFFDGDPEEEERTRLDRYLGGLIRHGLDTLQVDRILTPLAEASDALLREPELRVRDIIFEAQTAFDQSPINKFQIRQVHTRTYLLQDRAREMRSEVSIALTVVRRAEVWLEAIELAVRGFVMDRGTAPTALGKTKTEREGYVDRILTDVRIQSLNLERRRGELMLLDSRVSRNYEACDRALATMKQFSDLESLEARTTGRIDRGPAIVGREVEFAGGAAGRHAFGGGRTATRFQSG